MSEKLDFFEALRIVVGTKRRIRYAKRNWLRYVIANNCRRACLYSNDTENDWWPTLEQQKEKTWEVEPEKPKEICVYGVCDKDGSSRIMHTPTRKLADNWWAENGGYGIFLTEDNLFPKDKPQKFKLVPADQPTGIPWKKFIHEEMPGSQEPYLVCREECFPELAKWTYQSGDWRFERIDGVVLKDVDFYCHVSKIPKPELSDE